MRQAPPAPARNRQLRPSLVDSDQEAVRGGTCRSRGAQFIISARKTSTLVEELKAAICARNNRVAMSGWTM